MLSDFPPLLSLLCVANIQSLKPPRSPDPETATPSETEHAIQTLLIQGSSSCILVECPSHITRPATPCTPTEPPDPGPPSPCPDPPGQPSSTYSQPPSLSPQCLDPSDIVEPHSPYSDPPVLSPQAFPQVTEIEDAVDRKSTRLNSSHL